MSQWWCVSDVSRSVFVTTAVLCNRQYWYQLISYHSNKVVANAWPIFLVHQRMTVEIEIQTPDSMVYSRLLMVTLVWKYCCRYKLYLKVTFEASLLTGDLVAWIRLMNCLVVFVTPTPSMSPRFTYCLLFHLCILYPLRIETRVA